MTQTRTGRRAASAAIAAALIATLTLTGAVAAKDHPTKPDKAHPVKSGQTQGGGAGGGGAKPVVAEKPVSLKVKGNASHPGSVFRVNAVLKSARDVRPETMDAIVHFATGDVTVELTRQGGGAAYHAWVPVPEDEPEGVVLIDATAEVDGETVEASGAGKILDRGEGAEEDEIDEPEELQEPDASPEPCEPEESPEPNPSGDPDASPSPSAEASPSGDPEPSPSDDGDGDGNESPDPSGSPDAEETAEEDCDAADDDATQLTMAVLARIIAYIESLMA
jgi:hypothetical protein